MHCKIALIVGICCLPQMVLGQTEPILVRIDPAVTNVQVGDTFTVDLLADLGPHKVIGWGLDLAFDNTALAQVGSPEIGPLWMSSFAPDGDGLTGFSQSGSTGGRNVLLARLTYKALSAGQSDLLPGYTAADLNEGFPLDPFGYADIAFEGGTVIVTPEPTAGLLLSAIAALAFPRRRSTPRAA